MRVAKLGNGAVSSLLLDHEGCFIVFDSPAVPVLAPTGHQHTSKQQKTSVQLCAPDYAAAVNSSQMHAVLVTSAWGMLGLPHLWQQLQAQGLDLPLHTYCTEPCLHFFQQLSQELLDAEAALASAKQLQLQLQQPELRQQLPAAQRLHDQLAILHQQVQLLQQHGQQQPWQHQQQQQWQTLPPKGHSTGSLTAAEAPLPAGLVIVPLFTQQQLQGVLDAVQVVRFGQRVQLPGCFGVTAQARPSGSGIGSCMWLLSSGDQRCTYLGPASLDSGHSMPPHLSSMAGLDVLLVGPGGLSPQRCWAASTQQQLLQQQQSQPAVAGVQQRHGPSSSPDDVLAVAVGAAAAAVARGGRVLVPVIAGEGAVLQLLDHLPASLAAAGPAAASAQLVYMSPAAADALATVNSCCEYLEQQRQQRVLECGIAPFSSEQLLKTGQLMVLAPDATEATGGAAEVAAAGRPAAAVAAAGPHDEQPMCVDSPEQQPMQRSSRWAPLVEQVLQLGPCVVFAPLWSMAAGPGAMLAQAWSSSPSNLLLLPESGFLSASWLQQCLDHKLLPPQTQWQWNVQYVPLTTSLSANSSASAAGATDTTAAACSSAAGDAQSSTTSSSGIGNRAVAAALRHTPQGNLTAGELLSVLTHDSTQRQCRAAGTRCAGEATRGQRCQVMACGTDAALLEAALHQQDSSRLQLLPLPSTPQAPSHPTKTSSSSSNNRSGSHATLHWLQVQLPPPLLQASVTAELAGSLQLQRLRISRTLQQPPAGHPSFSAAGVPVPSQGPISVPAKQAGQQQGGEAVEQEQEVSVARVQALLTHRSGRWRLEPLPTGPRPKAVSAVLAVQQQPQQALLWGSIDTARLLEHLQAVGLQAEVLAPHSNGSKPPAERQPCTCVSVDGGAAQLRLGPQETEVVCDDAAMRQQLLQCLLKQLHHVG